MLSVLSRGGGVTRGQAIVEFAIVFPVFILLVMMIVDFGRVVWYDNAISNGAREGARYAIINHPSRDDPAIRQYVREKAVGVPLVDADITITPAVTRIARDPVKVSISYQFTPITPMVGDLIGGSVTLDASSQMIVER